MNVGKFGNIDFVMAWNSYDWYTPNDLKYTNVECYTLLEDNLDN